VSVKRTHSPPLIVERQTILGILLAGLVLCAVVSCETTGSRAEQPRGEPKANHISRDGGEAASSDKQHGARQEAGDARPEAYAQRPPDLAQHKAEETASASVAPIPAAHLKEPLARFFGVQVDEIEIQSSSASDALPTHSVGRAAVGEQKIPCRFEMKPVGQGYEIVTLTLRNGTRDPEKDMGPEKARTMARRIAAEKYPRWRDAGMKLTDTRRVPFGKMLGNNSTPPKEYHFHWDEFTDEGFRTGNGVSILIAADTGDLISYTGLFAKLPLKRPTVSREEAERTALAKFRKQRGDANYSYQMREPFCLLSSPYADGGPAWYFDFEWTLYGPPPYEVEFLDGVVVDGISGEVIEP